MGQTVSNMAVGMALLVVRTCCSTIRQLGDQDHFTPSAPLICSEESNCEVNSDWLAGQLALQHSVEAFQIYPHWLS